MSALLFLYYLIRNQSIQRWIFLLQKLFIRSDFIDFFIDIVNYHSLLYFSYLLLFDTQVHLFDNTTLCINTAFALQFHLDWVFDLRKYRWGMMRRNRPMWLYNLYLYFLRCRDIFCSLHFVQRTWNTYLLFAFSFYSSFKKLGCLILFLVKKLLENNDWFKFLRPAIFVYLLIDFSEVPFFV